MARLTFHGQSCYDVVTGGGARLLIDPFLTDNPVADVGPEHFAELDYLLLTHGHGDHIGDTFEILSATGATLIATYEIVSYAKTERGVADEKGHPMHIGGAHDFPFGRVKLTPAIHGGKIDGPNAAGYTTVPAGILLTVDGTTLYFAGDTALTKDMELLRGAVDIALVPIGDNFTMGPEDAGRAIEMIQPKVAIPCHYGTWPLIDVDPQRFIDAVGDAAHVTILQPGDSLEV